MMTNSKRNFDLDAATWDENPARLKLVNDISTAILQNINLDKEMDAMDFGCGTGLVTLTVAPHVKSITGIDSSAKMLEILAEKARIQNKVNVSTLKLDPDAGDKIGGNYDVIVSSMAFHHIENIDGLLAEFHRIIKPGGILCIADLESDGGLFHKDNTGVFHFGFVRTSLRHSFKNAGFININDVTATRVIRPDRNGIERIFTIFLMIGQKK